MSDLQHFLDEHRAQSHDTVTHTSTNPNGKYYISKDDTLAKFHYIYARDVDSKRVPSITEISSNHFIPLIVDIDLKAQRDDKNEFHEYKLYQPNHVADIVFCFLEILKEVIVDVEETDIYCFLFERDGYYVKKGEKNFFKNGFHLHFPKIFLTRSQIECVILPKVKERFAMTSIDLPNGMTPHTILDESLYKGKGKPWYMYGSSKPESPYPYLITGVFNANFEYEENWKEILREDLQVSSLTTTHLIDFFSINSSQKEMFIRDIYENIKVNELYVSKSKTTEKKQSTMSENVNTNIMTSHDNVFINELLDLLPINYCTDYDLWIEIGWILYNIYNGGIDGYTRWDTFSKRCPEKYDRFETEFQWSKMYTKNYTIASLKHYAKLSNPKGYEDLCDRQLQQCYDKSIYQSSVTHSDIADILFSKYEDTFVCACVKKAQWYKFSDHVWKLSDDGVHLRKLISTELVDEFIKLQDDCINQTKETIEREKNDFVRDMQKYKDDIFNEERYMQNLDPRRENDQKQLQASRRKIDKLNQDILKLETMIEYKKKELNTCVDSDSENKKKPKNEKLVRINKIISCLKTTPFKKNVMVEASEKFLNENFLREINRNAWIVAFNNGVYDLKNNIFRPGRPSDLLTLKMDVNYREDFTIDSPQVQMAKRFFIQIFPDPSVREYFLAVQSEVFVGRNVQKYWQIWTGEGDNGKSITQDIFEKMLGPLCHKLPTSIIIGKRTQSSGACPELERLGNGVRFVTIQETNSTDTINTGIMKELSGNDKFYARGLHKDPIDINPMFKMVMICNKPPQISSASQHDQAVWNRTRIIPFESYFPRDETLVPDTWEEQLEKKIFPRDNNFSDKIPDMLEGVAFYLLSIYRERGNCKIKEPEKVLLATDKYRVQNDFFREFLDEKVVVRVGAKLHLSILFDTFRNWYNDSYPGRKLPTKKEMKEYLVRLWNDPLDGNSSSWKDFAILEEDMSV